MNNYLDKINVPTAIEEKNKLDLSCQHITTSDFMQLNVAKIMELVPGEKVDVRMETFARLNPMVVPTLGRAAIKTSKFWVPFRTINKSFNDMVVDTIHINSAGDGDKNTIVDGVPTITNAQLVELFVGAAGTANTESYLLYTVDPLDETCDVALTTGYTSSTTSVVRYNFTEIGRQIYKMLLALGYNIIWEANYVDTYSFLPILALMRVYADWYFPVQYANLSVYQDMLSICNLDTGTWTLPQLSTLRGILRLMSYVQYDSSVYTAAWDNPNSPAQYNYSNYQLKNIDTIGQVYGKFAPIAITATTFVGGDSSYRYNNPGYISNNTGNATAADRVGAADAPFISPMVTIGSNDNYLGPTAISEYLLHGLHSLTDFLKRHQLVGTRAYERLLSRYGVSTTAEKINRSVFLGSSTQPVQIGDVMSTADTDGAELGKMAGKGISYGACGVDFETDEFGYLLILTSIVPMTGYFQGCDPLVLRTRRTQFYIPEFDNLGVEPVLSKTLYYPNLASAGFVSGSTYANQVFGFLPRYYAYKTSVHDTLTGNFRCTSLNGTSPLFPEAFNGASSWHLMRVLDYNSGDQVVHTPDFMYGKSDAGQYKRLFYAVSDDGQLPPDNFTIIHNCHKVIFLGNIHQFQNYEL